MKIERKTAPRGKGEGSVFPDRTKNRFAAQITVGYDTKNRRRYKTVYGKTKKEVIKKLTELKHLQENDLLPDNSSRTIANLLDYFLEHSIRQKRENTYTSYEVMVRVHIKPRIGNLRLSKLSAVEVEHRLLRGMEEDGVSGRLRQFAFDVLRSALKKAIRMGWLHKNVCDAIDRPKGDRVRHFNVLSMPQVHLFLEASQADRLHALYVMAIATGMRQGELLALRWHNVDLVSGDVSVTHTLLDIKGELKLGETKTKKGRRRITLPENARLALLAHKDRMLSEGHHTEWVFCDTQGGPIRKSNLGRRSFKPLLKKAGLPDFRFHDLRHTAATLMLGADINPKIVQEILGHSKVSVTLDTYSHVLPTMQTEAAERMNNLFNRKNS